LGIFLYAILALGWRELHDEARQRFNRMLRRHGAALGASGYEAAVATRRCVACANKEECEAWLRSGAHGSVEKFCRTRRSSSALRAPASS
jgi:hypothetical protein